MGGKDIGKSIGYTTMKDRLKRLWKLSRNFEIVDVDNGFKMVKFDLLTDKWEYMEDIRSLLNSGKLESCFWITIS